MDSSGNLFIVDQVNNRVRKVDTSGNISTVAGGGSGGLGDGGPATSARFNLPVGIAVDSSGNLFIGDQGNSRIRKVDTSGNISTVAGTTPGSSGDGGPATSAKLSGPAGVAVDSSGNLFITDSSNNLIRKVDTSGTISTVAGDGTQGFSGDGGPATSASLDHPSGVALDSSRNLFFADKDNDRIRKVDAVPVEADLSVTKTDSPDPITAAGATLTYTLTVTNGGPSTATNVVLTDTLPTGAVTFVSATPDQGSCSGTSTVACNLGTLVNGVSTTVTIKVTVNHGFKGTLTNTASVTATQNDPVSSDDSTTETTSVTAPAVIPGLSTWGLIALGVVLAGAAVFTLRLRPTSQA